MTLRVNVTNNLPVRLLPHIIIKCFDIELLSVLDSDCNIICTNEEFCNRLRARS